MLSRIALEDLIRDGAEIRTDDVRDDVRMVT